MYTIEYSCAKDFLEKEMFRLQKDMEEKLNKFSQNDKKDHQWDIMVFYWFDFNEKHELSDKYTIWVIYHENEDAKQQKFKFEFSSAEGIFLNKICQSIYMYITKSYLEKDLTGYEDMNLWYPETYLKMLITWDRIINMLSVEVDKL